MAISERPNIFGIQENLGVLFKRPVVVVVKTDFGLIIVQVGLNQLVIFFVASNLTSEPNNINIKEEVYYDIHYKVSDIYKITVYYDQYLYYSSTSAIHSSHSW